MKPENIVLLSYMEQQPSSADFEICIQVVPVRSWSAFQTQHKIPHFQLNSRMPRASFAYRLFLSVIEFVNIAKMTVFFDCSF